MAQARPKRLIVVPESSGPAADAGAGRDAGTVEARPIHPEARNIWLVPTIRLLVLVAAALLGIGLVAPAMEFHTSFGRYDGWLRLIAPELLRESQSVYSLLGGILTLMRQGNLWLGLLLLVFSCIFPTFKLMLMAWANEALARRQPAGRLLTLAHHTGKFSMLDVMVLALLVIAIKGLPGSSDLRLDWGVWAFALSVVLSLVASVLLHRLERRDCRA